LKASETANVRTKANTDMEIIFSEWRWAATTGDQRGS